MSKDAYYFSHDSNARNDPKIGAMRSVYGSEGYGWFWILVEMMRDSQEYKLDMTGKYIFNAYAKQMDADADAAKRYVEDCINEFQLFSSDGTFFWSESLLRRMAKKEDTSEKRRNAANKRWSKNKEDATDMQKHSKSNAIGMQGKERKKNESKVNEKKDKILHLINLNKIQYNKDDQLEFVFSYINNMDFEVIEDVIARANGNHINYILKTLGNKLREGKTTKDTIRPIQAVPDQKVDKELEARQIEIARNKWIAEGNKPDEFEYRPASNT